jgi:hypothetical protein
MSTSVQKTTAYKACKMYVGEKVQETDSVLTLHADHCGNVTDNVSMGMVPDKMFQFQRKVSPI